MLILDVDKIHALATMPRLIACLEEAFRSDFISPLRQVVALPGGAEPATGGDTRLFISMSAFDQRGGGAVKLVTLFPDNAAKGLPTIQAAIVVFSDTGTPVAMLDGTVVTRLRTGAASALASRYLSRTNSEHLVIMGTGSLAPYMALAHCAVRPIKRISVCGRHAQSVAATIASIRALLSRAERTASSGIEVEADASAEHSIASADIVSCSTRSATPIVQGRWLKAGAFVDLVGSFSPDCRESDDDVVRRSRIFVDTHAGAMAEAGDILDPLARGVIGKDKIEGDLADLIRGRIKGRMDDDEITLFKSVGTAIEDLAAAQMIVAAARQI